MKSLSWRKLLKPQNKSKGKTGLEHNVAMSNARSFPHTMISYESKAPDQVRANAGLIMLGITRFLGANQTSNLGRVERFHLPFQGWSASLVALGYC